MISGQKYTGPEADVWSLGVILFTFVAGFLPFDDDNESRVHAKILGLEFNFPEFVDSDARSLVIGILKVEPKLRFTIDQIISHEWLTRSTTTSTPSSLPIAVKEIAPHVQRHVFQSLDQLGFDTTSISRSVAEDTCDSRAALYHLLCDKFLGMKEEMCLPPATSSLTSLKITTSVSTATPSALTSLSDATEVIKTRLIASAPPTPSKSPFSLDTATTPSASTNPSRLGAGAFSDSRRYYVGRKTAQSPQSMIDNIFSETHNGDIEDLRSQRRHHNAPPIAEEEPWNN